MTKLRNISIWSQYSFSFSYFYINFELPIIHVPWNLYDLNWNIVERAVEKLFWINWKGIIRGFVFRMESLNLSKYSFLFEKILIRRRVKLRQFMKSPFERCLKPHLSTNWCLNQARLSYNLPIHEITIFSPE